MGGMGMGMGGGMGGGMAGGTGGGMGGTGTGMYPTQQMGSLGHMQAMPNSPAQQQQQHSPQHQQQQQQQYHPAQQQQQLPASHAPAAADELQHYKKEVTSCMPVFSGRD